MSHPGRIEKAHNLAELRDPFTAFQRYLDQNICDLFVNLELEDIQTLLNSYKTTILDLPGDPSSKLPPALQLANVPFELSKYKLYLEDTETDYGAYLPFRYLYEDFTPKHIKILLIAYIIYHKLGQQMLENKYFHRKMDDIEEKYSHALYGIFGGGDLRISVRDNLVTLGDVISLLLLTKEIKNTDDLEKVFNLLFSLPESVKLSKYGKNNISLMGHAGFSTIAALKIDSVIFNVIKKDSKGNFHLDETFWNFLLHYNSDKKHGGCPASFTIEENSYKIGFYQDLQTQISGIESMFRTFEFIFLYIKKNYNYFSKSLNYIDYNNLRPAEIEG